MSHPATDAQEAEWIKRHSEWFDAMLPDLIRIAAKTRLAADAVTRDSAGNVIPLSKRFQAEEADIRFAAEPRETVLPTWPREAKGQLVVGWRGERSKGSRPTPENIAFNDGGTEGMGLYVAKDKELAGQFRGTVRKITFAPPARVLNVDEEPLHILQETEDLMQPPTPSDSPWLAAHKVAVAKTGITDETWGAKQWDLQRALTDELLNRGYTAVHVTSGGEEWVVLLAKPKEFLRFAARFGQGLLS